MAYTATPSAPSAQAPRADSDAVRLNEMVSYMTVEKLKAVLRKLNADNRASLRVTGNKSELQSRIYGFLASLRDTNAWTQYEKARQIIAETANGPSSSTSRSYTSHVGPSTSRTGPSTAGSSNEVPPNKLKLPPNGSPSGPGFAPFAYNNTSLSTSAHRSATSSSAHRPVTFKSSPFYDVVEHVSYIAHCPVAGSQEKRFATLQFTLNDEQRTKLQQPNSPYQLRLFSTTKDAYDFFTSLSVPNSARTPCPVEFPLNCEARVNATLLPTSLRGSKKHPTRVPPPDLNQKGLLKMSGMNRVELVYINTTKEYLLCATLVKVRSVEEVVEQVRKRKFRPKEDVVRALKQMAEEDDIVTTASSLSLKCPLSYMRMTVPSRSIICHHVQCFDAYSFFSVNEQAPTWQCPVCSRTVKPEDITVDGYVADILKRVPDTEDDVVVEADGTWRTRDGKFTSDGAAPLTADIGARSRTSAAIKEEGGDSSDEEALARAIAKGKAPEKPSVPVGGGEGAGEGQGSEPPGAPVVRRRSSGGGAAASSTVVLSDDEGGPSATMRPVHLQPVHSLAVGTQASPVHSGQREEVIDLTLSSDEESGPRGGPAPPPPPRQPTLASIADMCRRRQTFTDLRDARRACANGGSGRDEEMDEEEETDEETDTPRRVRLRPRLVGWREEAEDGEEEEEAEAEAEAEASADEGAEFRHWVGGKRRARYDLQSVRHRPRPFLSDGGGGTKRLRSNGQEGQSESRGGGSNDGHRPPANGNYDSDRGGGRPGRPLTSSDASSTNAGSPSRNRDSAWAAGPSNTNGRLSPTDAFAPAYGFNMSAALPSATATATATTAASVLSPTRGAGGVDGNSNSNGTGGGGGAGFGSYAGAVRGLTTAGPPLGYRRPPGVP